MEKAKTIINFYVLTNKLKNIVRTGWKNWHVNTERVESVAEHIYGTQMLALAIHSEYQYDIDIKKVIYMLAIHELEETIIGDLTHKDITREEKEKIGHQAVENILKDLLTGEEIKKIIYEFDERKTKEAKFAYLCDKLECDLQCKIYDENHYVKPEEQLPEDNHREDVMQKLRSGEITWSSSWLNHDRPIYEIDNNFMEILDYALNNDILNNDK